MTPRIPTLAAALALGAALAGCDLFDPTGIENPNLTQENVLSTSRPLRFWVQGLERQAAVAFSNYLTEAEIVSDNYDNTATFFDQELDGLSITFTNANVDNMLFAFSDLRESARFGRTVVAAADEGATDAEVAETYFFEALADVVLGQAFTAAPIDSAGPPTPPADHLRAALGLLDEALDLQPDAGKRTGYLLLKARAHHALGDRAEAVEVARAALAADPDYIRFVAYDETNGVNNDLEGALYDRASFDDLQPLPRLDFLDPKYAGAGGVDAPVPFLKAEEAHLVLAEAALAEGDLDGAKAQMRALLDLVETRPFAEVDDNTEGRTQSAPGSRPNVADVLVRASPDAPFRSGLVLTRNGPGVTVDVPTVSGTSVTAEMVAALASVDEAVRLLYLLRQEVFIAEGRRMFDLGIRFPVTENEVLSNPNTFGAEVTTGFVPGPLRPFAGQFDAFSYDAAARQATVLVDLNRVLAQNRQDDALVPFF